MRGGSVRIGTEFQNFNIILKGKVWSGFGFLTPPGEKFCTNAPQTFFIEKTVKSKGVVVFFIGTEFQTWFIVQMILLFYFDMPCNF